MITDGGTNLTEKITHAWKGPFEILMPKYYIQTACQMGEVDESCSHQKLTSQLEFLELIALSGSLRETAARKLNIQNKITKKHLADGNVSPLKNPLRSKENTTVPKSFML